MAVKELSLRGEAVAQKPKRKYLKIILPVVGFFVLLAVGVSLYLGLVVIPNAKAFTASVESAFAQAEEVQEAIEAEDVAKAKEETVKLKEDLQDSKEKLQELGFVRFIPLVNGYYNDADHLMSAAIIATEAGEIGADGILPFADVLGLKGKKSKTTAEEKTQIIVKKVIPSLIPIVDKLEDKLELIDKEISQVDPYRYPEALTIKGFRVRKGLLEVKDGVDKAQEIIPNAKTLLSVAPNILGHPKEKTLKNWGNSSILVFLINNPT